MAAVRGEPGTVFTWGLGRSGELGHGQVDKEGVCAFPSPVMVGGAREKGVVIMVACGERATAAVTRDGQLWTWGNGRKGRLGHGDEADCATPRHVAGGALSGVVVVGVALGEGHGACWAANPDGRVFTWGCPSRGALGPPECAPKGPRDHTRPTPVDALPPPKRSGGVAMVACGYRNTAVLMKGGDVYVWGDNDGGKLGVEAGVDGVGGSRRVVPFVPAPTRLAGLPGPTQYVSLGSLYGGCVLRDGSVWMFGRGGWGNLGTGDRCDRSVPTRVQGFGGDGQPKAVTIACTCGQINPPPPLLADKQGTEGPHTITVDADGSVWSWGTCHKGVLGNMRNRVLCGDGDELVPYKVGGPARDVVDATEDKSGKEDTTTGYLSRRPITAAVSSSIHSAVLTTDGALLTFGCGSDGRMGVRQYLEGLSGGRSRLKCYVSQPTPVVGLEGDREGGAFVLAAASSRRHMAAIVRDRNKI